MVSAVTPFSNFAESPLPWPLLSPLLPSLLLQAAKANTINRLRHKAISLNDFFIRSDVDKRQDEWCTMESALEENAQCFASAKKYNANIIFIDDSYETDICL